MPFLAVKTDFRNNWSGTCKICGCRIPNYFEYCAEHFTSFIKEKKVSKLKGRKRVKKPAFGIKSKVERQKWWADLSDQQRVDYLIKVQERKSAKRKAKSIKIMANRKAVNCKQCFHGISKSCTDTLPRGCEYHYVA